MIRFRTFGSAALTSEEGAEYPSVLARPKLLGLVSYLAASTPHGFHRRDTLLGLFWAEVDQERARRALRQSLYHLRQALGDDVIVGRGDEEIGLAPNLLWSDVAAFDAALDGGELEEALDLYQGDLLQGFYVSDAPEFEQWLDQRRTQLREAAATAAWTLAERGLDQKNPAGAAFWGRRAFALAPLDERLLRRLIRLLDRVGDRAGAVREYESFARRLDEALELEPSPETRDLIAQVRARSQAPPDRVTAATVDHPADREPKEQPEDPTKRPAREERVVEDTIIAGEAAGEERQSGVDDQLLTKALNHRYVLEDHIGTGGMATVYLARDTKHDRHVAVKVFQPELAAVIGSQRFLQEIKITAKLEHPHILTLIDSGESDSILYYVMPYVAGESLRTRLRRQKQLPLEEALAITREVAAALDYAHRRGVIHRDIKPENILIHEGTAIVADFGIALAVRAAGGTRLTQTGMSLGTPSYMSPEQATGDQQLDARSDIYSLGAVLYEMLVSEPPHTGPSSQAIIAKLMTERPTRPRALRDTVPPAVDDAVMKALARLPADRFASVTQFGEALESAADSQPAESADKRPRGLDNRRRLWPVVVAGALLVLWALSRAVFPSSDAAGGASVAEGLLRDRPSVAVLPFDNLSPSDEDAYLADGVHEEILTRLSKISALIVISRSSVLRYRDHGLTGPQIAAELSVSALLEGSVQKAGDQIKITAQLIDGETDAHLWGESYDRAFSIENLFDIQSEIAFRIVENLRATLTPQEQSRVTRAPTENMRAYELYLRGRRAYDLYQSSENANAMELYKQAIGLDPSFAAAWAGLGDAYAQGILLFGLESTWWDSAQAASQRAISLDADRADGYKALGLVHMSRGWYRPALDAFLQALEIEPNHPTAAANVSVVLMRFGSLDESLLWNRRALSVGPNHMLIRANMAWSYLALGELDIAQQWARQTIALEQGMVHAHWALSAVAAARGDHARALEIAERVIEIDPDSPARRQFAAEIALFGRDLASAARHSTDALGMSLGGSIPPWHFPGATLGYVLRQRGEIERAREHLQGTRAAVEQLIASGADDPRLPWEIGCIHAIQGELDEALVWLERGFREGWRWTVEIQSDPLLDAVRGSPRFVRLVAEMIADVETMRRQALQMESNAHLR